MPQIKKTRRAPTESHPHKKKKNRSRAPKLHSQRRKKGGMKRQQRSNCSAMVPRHTACHAQRKTTVPPSPALDHLNPPACSGRRPPLQTKDTSATSRTRRSCSHTQRPVKTSTTWPPLHRDAHQCAARPVVQCALGEGGARPFLSPSLSLSLTSPQKQHTKWAPAEREGGNGQSSTKEGKERGRAGF